MRHFITFQGLFIIVLFSAVAVLPVHSTDVTVGLLAGNNKLGEVETAAYDWADDNFQATLLVVDGNGVFKKNGSTAVQLDQFAVLWLFYTETNKLPAPFQAQATQKAIYNYIDAGGSMFLSALALSYVVDLGVEKGGKPRVFQPLSKGNGQIGVIPTADSKNHPVYKGFDTSKPVFITIMQQAGFTADFISFKENPPAGKILGTKTLKGGKGAGERPFVEYEVNQGKIITLGHHNGVYTDTKSPESDNLRKLTENVLTYLGENSVFFAVDPNGKLATTWGNLKSAMR